MGSNWGHPPEILVKINKFSNAYSCHDFYENVRWILPPPPPTRCAPKDGMKLRNTFILLLIAMFLG